MLYEDCESPYSLGKYFLDDSPHCLAEMFNGGLGQSMMAFACADIIVCLASLMMTVRTRYAYNKVSFSSISSGDKNSV
jgi:hypothetical protein